MTKLDFLCDITVPLVRTALKRYYTINYEGEFPKNGPCLIFSKHVGDMDQFFVGLMLQKQGRLANYLMREFPFPLNYVLRLYGGILVVRAKDIAKGKYGQEEADEINYRAARYAISRLKLGEPVLSFPEGTRAPNTLRLPLRLGIAEKILYAQEKGAFNGKLPMSAVGIECKNNGARSNVWVRAGEPFYASKTSELEEHLHKELPKLSNIQP